MSGRASVGVPLETQIKTSKVCVRYNGIFKETKRGRRKERSKKRYIVLMKFPFEFAYKHAHEKAEAPQVFIFPSILDNIRTVFESCSEIQHQQRYKIVKFAFPYVFQMSISMFLE